MAQHQDCVHKQYFENYQFRPLLRYIYCYKNNENNTKEPNQNSVYNEEFKKNSGARKARCVLYFFE